VTARAHAEFDLRAGVRAIVYRDHPAGDTTYRTWETRRHFVRADGESEPQVDDGRDMWLRLDPEEARALYDALGEYFGHTSTGSQALRKDYEAERKRVDTLISHLTERDAERPRMFIVNGTMREAGQ